MPSTSFIYLYFQLIASFLPHTLSSPEQIEQKSRAFFSFGSLHTLEMLSNASAKEEEIYTILKLRHQHLINEIGLIRTYIEEYKKSQKSALGGIKLQPAAWKNLMESSPVLGHRLVHGYVKSVDKIRKLLKSKDYTNVTKHMKQALEIQNDATENQQEWPNTDDLYVSHHAILDIQYFYDFGSGEIFQGQTYDTNFGGYLKPSHCALFGMMALNIGHLTRSVEWLELTLAYIDNEFRSTDDNSVSVDLVKRLLRNAIQEHNYRHDINSNSPQILEEDFYMFDEPIYLGQKWSKRVQVRKPLLESYGKIYGNDSFDFISMISLCMGNDLQPQEIKSRLHCYLDRKLHPYFILNPLKTEQLSEYPYVVQLYDVLGNDTLEEMYKKRGKLRMSTVVDEMGISHSLSVRSSAGSGAKQDFMYKIQNKSEIISGLLLTDMFEGIQTAEYTYGRHYKNHNDPMTPAGLAVDIVNGNEAEKVHGDRLGSILYYGDVPSDGGATAFNQVGITARPVRGSVVFWINMFRNGSIRTDISHASCPVIHGHKTIIMQGVRYNSNFQTFKCSLNQFD